MRTWLTGATTKRRPTTPTSYSPSVSPTRRPRLSARRSGPSNNGAGDPSHPSDHHQKDRSARGLPSATPLTTPSHVVPPGLYHARARKGQGARGRPPNRAIRSRCERNSDMLVPSAKQGQNRTDRIAVPNRHERDQRQALRSESTERLACRAKRIWGRSSAEHRANLQARLWSGDPEALPHVAQRDRGYLGLVSRSARRRRIARS